MIKLQKGSLRFNMNLKDFKFSDDVLLRGTTKLKSGSSAEMNFQHIITILSYDLMNVNERKIRFRFRLIMRPDVGEINFDGECILESLNQDKIHMAFKLMINFIDRFLLQESYYHAEEFMKQENFLFPPANIILKKFGIKSNK